MLASLLERHDVTEELTVRSRFGFMAYHGGTLEKTTDPIAREAAELAGASYYGVVQRDEDPTHFLFYENWESRELWQARMNAPHLAAYKEATEGAIAGFTLHEMSRIG